MTFGEKIKTLRKEQHLTLKMLAKRSGLSIVGICHLENDNHEPSPITVKKLADALNCDFNELWEIANL